jgi:endonuclease/exonuclease/phosphatase (EEP) superfamily protein YafD
MHASHGIRQDPTKARHEPHAPPEAIRVISWNLLRLVGAGAEDVATLIERHRPDLLLMQEATKDLESLPSLVGGHFSRLPMKRRVYGLAAWSPHPFPPPQALPLPVSTMPGRLPQRIAQIVQFGEITFANVHLSHGQFLNRWQLLHIMRTLEGPVAIVGDYNAVGPIRLAGLRDVGPRQPTHSTSNVISLRLDRCMVRGLQGSHAHVLERGPSDHHPIILDLAISSGPAHVSKATASRRVLHGPLRVNVEGLLRALSRSPDRIRVPRLLSEPRRTKKPRRKSTRPSSLTPADDGTVR